jgi:hypothetical protein
LEAVFKSLLDGGSDSALTGALQLPYCFAPAAAAARATAPPNTKARRVGRHQISLRRITILLLSRGNAAPSRSLWLTRRSLGVTKALAAR